MTLTVTHTTPADGTFSATGAAAWDATHTLSVTGTSLQVQYNNAGDLSGMSGTSWDDTNRALTVTGATVTTSNPVLNLSQTWNNAATTFTGYKLNVTNTASAADSLFADFQVGGTSYFNVRLNSTSKTRVLIGSNDANGVTLQNYDAGGTGKLVVINSVGNYGLIACGGIVSNATIDIRNGGFLGFNNGDFYMRAKSANFLQFGLPDAAAPVAQTIGVQSVVAGATTNTPGADFTIAGSQGLGSGIGGSIIFKVAPAGTAGNPAQNALATALTIASDKTATFASSVTASGGFFIDSSLAYTTDGGGSGLIRVANTFPFTFGSSTLKMSPSVSFGWVPTGSQSYQAAADTILARDAANTLAQRNGVNAQTFRVYNTYTDASNYERGTIKWSSNIFEIGVEYAGTGTQRGTRISGWANFVSFSVNGVDRVNISTTDISPQADNAMTLGLIARRWTNVFQAGYTQLSEMTAPAAPATNDVRVYAEDNGAGKTRLMARFATGAAVQIAIEP